MGSLASSPFRNAAIASGLLTAEQIQAALLQLQKEGVYSGQTSVDDDMIIAVLVEQNLLNAWQAEQLRSGRTRFNLGPYRIFDSIGRGGMGQVFKAEHTMMGRTVAIKVLPKSRCTPLAVESFMREIRAQAKLDDPYLVRAYDAGFDGNVYYLVTEYVPGFDLRKLVRRRIKLGMREAASIISQVAKGLAHAHSVGLIHRDVKPGNVLVNHDGMAKLSDLGLAGFLSEINTGDPRAGKIVGTADYLPPEQIRNPRDVYPTGDIYSLGCTLYYAVTGKVPFPGGAIKDKLKRHCEDTAINPRHFNDELTDDFLAVLSEMMEKEPVLRLRSASEVVERLEPWAHSALSLFDEHEDSASDSSFSFPDLWARNSELDEMADTAPAELESPPIDHSQYSSPSQISQTTDPVLQALEETIPTHGIDPIFKAPRDGWRTIWLGLGIAAGLVALFALLMILFSRG